MRYRNDLFQSTNPPQNEPNNTQKHLFIGVACAALITVSYAFFAEKSEPSAPETIALTIHDITTKIAQTGKTETFLCVVWFILGWVSGLE
jgi:CDP-diglyceride synthetase